jgi:diguanylate cyclase (GGDEF)-like protein
MRLPARDRSTWRLFLAYAAASLIPVVLLGLVLSFALAAEARDRGLAEGRAQAALVARTAVEPLLDGRSLAQPLSAAELAGLRRLTDRAVGAGHVVRLRLRDPSGRVVFSDDGSGFGGATEEDEVAEAVRGSVEAHLTRLNTDRNDTGPAGQRVVEVYLPLRMGGTVVGVLEIYLPYDPIDADVSAGLRTLYLVLGAGLAALWAILAAVSASTMRRLRHAADRNAYLADHDTLTELPNRTLFQRRAAAAVEAARRAGGSAAIVVADLDRFKEVNDTLGHHNGDALLRQLGERLAGEVRAGDTVARLGGDEFGLVLPAVREDEVRVLLERLRATLEREVMIDTLPLSAEASFGYALAPADGTDVETLLRRADVAMYLAKESRAGHARYDSVRDHYDAAKLALVAELRRAIEGGELVLHYQPKAWVRSGAVCAVEALVRWQHPQRGLVPPDAFLPVAEQTGLIEPLTRWVLSSALDQVRRWGAEFESLTMSVNISARNLSRPDFADTVLTALDTAGVPAHRLVLEITETALLADPETAAKVLGRVAAVGVRVSIDDFGQGHTSLGYLSTLPLHELKIDKSFVADLPVNHGHAAIVRSIVELGHNLGLHVVAEGVETDQILDVLASVDCDIAQGYLLARPMPPDQLPGWLAVHRTPVPAGPPG